MHLLNPRPSRLLSAYRLKTSAPAPDGQGTAVVNFLARTQLWQYKNYSAISSPSWRNLSRTFFKASPNTRNGEFSHSNISLALR